MTRANRDAGAVDIDDEAGTDRGLVGEKGVEPLRPSRGTGS
jgi:hypothetical protein